MCHDRSPMITMLGRIEVAIPTFGQKRPFPPNLTAVAILGCLPWVLPVPGLNAQTTTYTGKFDLHEAHTLNTAAHVRTLPKPALSKFTASGPMFSGTCWSSDAKEPF